jgi:hypothetical protein
MAYVNVNFKPLFFKSDPPPVLAKSNVAHRQKSWETPHLDGPTLGTVHRPGDDPRKECEECGNARGSNVRYYPT